MLYRFEIYRNALRRWIVKRLLGRRLIVQKKNTPSGPEWQLIDRKRRIPYGWVRVERIDDRDFKILWSGQDTNRRHSGKYSGLTYAELLRASANVARGKDARELHRELKEYGDGLFFFDRYPYLTLFVSSAAIITSLAALVTICTKLLLKL